MRLILSLVEGVDRALRILEAVRLVLAVTATPRARSSTPSTGAAAPRVPMGWKAARSRTKIRVVTEESSLLAAILDNMSHIVAEVATAIREAELGPVLGDGQDLLFGRGSARVVGLTATEGGGLKFLSPREQSRVGEALVVRSTGQAIGQPLIADLEGELVLELLGGIHRGFFLGKGSQEELTVPGMEGDQGLARLLVSQVEGHFIVVSGRRVDKDLFHTIEGFGQGSLGVEHEVLRGPGGGISETGLEHRDGAVVLPFVEGSDLLEVAPKRHPLDAVQGVQFVRGDFLGLGRSGGQLVTQGGGELVHDTGQLGLIHGGVGVSRRRRSPRDEVRKKSCLMEKLPKVFVVE